MFGEHGIRVSYSRTWRMLAINTAEFFLAALVLSGILHATPIKNSEERHGHSAKPLIYAVLADAAKTELRSNATSSAPRSASPTAQQTSSGCIFANNCADPVHISEPQALAVLGTGMLSIAGMLRRYTTRDH